MINDLVLIAGLCGLTLILVRGRIFYEVRAMVQKRFPQKDAFIDGKYVPMESLIAYSINCPQCVGFWVGLFGALLYMGTGQLLMVFLTGCTVSLLSVLADRYIFGRV